MGIVDGTIIEAMATQHVEVGGPHLLWRFGELLGVGTQRHILRSERRLAPIVTDVVDEQIGGLMPKSRSTSARRSCACERLQ